MAGRTSPGEPGPFAARPAREQGAVGTVRTPAVGRDTPHEAIGEVVGLTLRVGPEHVVTHLVVDGVDPLALGVVFPAVLPVLGVDQVDGPVFVGPAGRPPPVEVLEPGDPGWSEAIEPGNPADGPAEVTEPVFPEEAGEEAVDRPPVPAGGKDHSHGRSPSPSLLFWPFPWA